MTVEQQGRRCSGPSWFARSLVQAMAASTHAVPKAKAIRWMGQVVETGQVKSIKPPPLPARVCEPRSRLAAARLRH